MADFSGSGFQLPDLQSGQGRPSDGDGVLRIYSRQQALYGRDELGAEYRLTGDFYTANLYGTPKAERDKLHFQSVVLTTNGNGDLTYTFPQAFRALPAISLSPVASSTGQPTVVEIVAASATQVQIRTWRNRTVSVLLGGLLNPTERAPNTQVVATFIGILA